MKINSSIIRDLDSHKDKYEAHSKAENSVEIVRSYLHANGWITTNKISCSANGRDIVAVRRGESAIIEVKSAIYSSRAWKVKKVLDSSVDYIAIVFPNGKIHFDTIRMHLSECSKNGDRSLTGLAKIYM